MPALSINATSPIVVNDIEDAVTAAELDWLEDALRDAQAPGYLSDPASFKRFDDAWLRLERLAAGLGMLEGQGDGVVAWAEDYLRQRGRTIHQPVELTVGTPEYRERHVAMLWQASLWHEATMILFGAAVFALLFYAIAKDIQSWM